MRANVDRPFLIVGSPRSGTTLLVQMLNRHPRLFIPPETAFFLQLARYRREHPHQSFDLPSFTRWYLTSRPAKYLNVDEQVAGRLLAGATEPVDVLANLMSFLLERSGKCRWGEKTPEHVHNVDDLCRCFPDSQFIVLVRDGRAVVRSRLEHPEWRDNLYSAARKWRHDIQAGLKLMEQTGDRSIEVRYESLVLEPQATIHRILDFLGEDQIDCEDAMSNQTFDEYYARPWMCKSTDAPDHSRISAWRDKYTPLQLRALEGFIGKQLQSLGYPLVVPATHQGWRLLAAIAILQHVFCRIWVRLSRRLGMFKGG